MSDETQNTPNKRDDARFLPAVTRMRGGKPFAKGNAGRPKGAKNRVTRLVDEIISAEGPDIVNAIISHAKAGNNAAITAVARVIFPERKGRAVRIDLERALDGSAASLASATTAVLQATMDGRVSPEEANGFGMIIAAAARAYQVEEFESRLMALEAERDGK